MAITAAMVMELRAKTGCGMMECKKALLETNGDFEAAIKYLRERGLASAEKKASRIASDGIVDIMKSEDGKFAVILEVNTETDFVAKNESFREFVNGILKTILAVKPATIDELLAASFNGSDVTVEAELKNEIFTIGEKMSIRRFEIVEGITGTYIHGKGQVGVITKFDVSADSAAKDEFAEYAKNVCMQITAMNPIYVCKECVPESVIENEKGILLTQINNDPAMASKPEAVKEKMVAGKVGKYYSQNCLTEQQYVRDENLTVGAYTKEVGKAIDSEIKIVSFIKYEKGEGIEKREDDFASEIEKLVNG